MSKKMGNLRKSLLPITTFARIDIKRLFRDKVAIFFVFVFPLMFLLIFGNIFGGNNGDVSFRVALINNSETEFAADFAGQLEESEVFDISDDIVTVEAAEEEMGRGQITSTIVLPEDFGAIGAQGYPTGQAQVIYDQNSQQAGQTLTSIMEANFQEINAEFVQIETPFTVQSESSATAGLTSFDYLFSGLLGFTLLSLGIFGPTTVFPRLKQRGVLRRYRTTTLKVWQYFTGNVISNGAIGLLAVAMMFVAAFTVFDLNMRGDYFNLAIVVLLGATLMFGIGLALGGWAKNENQAAPLTQLVALPMMFLSGVFFPTFLMPELLQNITQFIPLTPIVDAVRLVVTEGATVLDLGEQLAIIGGWIVFIYITAFKVFRWE